MAVKVIPAMTLVHTYAVNPLMRPMRKQPIRLTATVGQPFLIPLITVIVMYFAAPPMKLQVSTINMFLMISVFSLCNKPLEE